MDTDKLTAKDIVEQIMTQHWDLIACHCWVCQAGRRTGIGPVKEHLQHVSGYVFPRVEVGRGAPVACTKNKEGII